MIIPELNHTIKEQEEWFNHTDFNLRPEEARNGHRYYIAGLKKAVDILAGVPDMKEKIIVKYIPRIPELK